MSSPRKHQLILQDAKSALSIRQFLDHLPQQSGVYLMFSARGQVCYVGKARDLSKRIRSYFRAPAALSAKERALVHAVSRIECLVTATEVEALILEAGLIKHHRPRYNICLKDDKSYPYIRVTNERFPRIRKTRTLLRDGSRYYGPFPSVRDMRALLQAASRIFYARSCNETLPFPAHRRECLDYHIGRCLAPCTRRITARDYAAMIEQAEELLAGNAEPLAARLEEEMRACSTALDFERAALLRDQIRSIKRVAAAQHVVADKEQDLDAVALAIQPPLSLAVVLEIRGGRLIGRKAHRLTFVADTPPPTVMAAFLQQYYLNSGHDLAPTLLLNTPLPKDTPLLQAIATASGRKVKILHPRRGEKKRLIEMAEAQGRRLLHEHSIIQPADSVTRALRDLAAILALDAPPSRIEAFDISHVQGTHVVAGMVVFCDGTPERSEYRRFKIRGNYGNNDFASMREAVFRRYSRVVRDHLEAPSLILIDGGKGQLSAAVDALRSASANELPVFAIAKELEQIFRPGDPKPIPISPASPGHLLLRRIRDEVHRYSVTYHRSLRGRSSLESQLDQIPGVGIKRRQKLLVRFGSAAAIEAAGFAAVAEVPGIGAALARRILLHLSGNEHEV